MTIQEMFLGVLASIYLLLLGYSFILVVRFQVSVHRAKMTRHKYKQERRRGFAVAILLSMVATTLLIIPTLESTITDVKGIENDPVFYLWVLTLCSLPSLLHGVGAIIAYQCSSERILDE